MKHLIALLLCAATAAATDKPRLVVVVSLDQMRPDTLQRFAKEYTGGLKRVLERGLHYRGVLEHALTQTGPGHSTMLTGCRPARTGIVANGWLERGSLKNVYCVEDAAAPVWGAKSKGRSPKLLLTSSLGDWMRAADPGAQVFSVSGKDRSAVLMGGRHANGAFWLEKGAGGFSSSAYYYPDGLPDWVKSFNRDGWYDQLPKQWKHETVDWLRADDHPSESSRYSRTTPHPLRGAVRRKTLDRIYRSPYIDEWTLRLASHLVRYYDLGGDASTDLLCVSLSATDTVGHLYGPFSQEIRDCTLRLDRNLGAFFDLLDKRGAPYVVAVTADHGVLPMTELTRVDARKVIQAATVAVQRKFGAADLFRIYGGTQVWLKPRKGVDMNAVRDTLAQSLRAQDAIAHVLDLDKLHGKDPIVDLVRYSYHPDRCGDLYVVPKEKVLLTTYGATGTNHGSPYGYDRDVPVSFLGVGIPAGKTGRVGRTIDIGPTLAHLLGLPVPEGLDGTVLSLKP